MSLILGGPDVSRTDFDRLLIVSDGPDVLSASEPVTPGLSAEYSNVSNCEWLKESDERPTGIAVEGKKPLFASCDTGKESFPDALSTG